MTPRKPKSLGTLSYPSARFESIDCSRGQATLVLIDRKRKIRIVIDSQCYSLLRLANRLTTAQKRYAARQERLAQRMIERTRFEEVDDE